MVKIDNDYIRSICFDDLKTLGVNDELEITYLFNDNDGESHIKKVEIPVNKIITLTDDSLFVQDNWMGVLELKKNSIDKIWVIHKEYKRFHLDCDDCVGLSLLILMLFWILFFVSVWLGYL